MAGSEWLTYADFAGRVGAHFDLVAGDVTVPVELVEATESTESGGPGPAGEQRRQFSLVFRGPREPALGQGIRRLVHPEMSALELFLVPIGADADGVRYEAAFA